MNPHDHAWKKLAAAARRAPQDVRDAAAPAGFATRIAALALSAERPASASFERFSWRALSVAGLLAAACVVADYSVFNGSASDDELLPDDGAASALMDFSS